MTVRNSGVSRILSASAASWVRIGVTVVTQVALVPLYLISWEADTFGVWLLLQATWTIITVVDLAHHDYVGYECLRIGATNRIEIGHVISSAVPIACVIAVWDVLFVWWLSNASFASGWFGNDPNLLGQWRAALLLQGVTWLFTGSQAGLMGRLLTPFGYYPQVAWWSVLHAVVVAALPAVAVTLGADLWGATLAMCIGSLVHHSMFFLAMFRIARRENLSMVKPNLLQGAVRGLKSLWLTSKYLSEVARQQGSRILLAPLSGAADMAAFSIMKTGANFALQGLNAAAGPVMPELMRFLVARDQQRIESAFAVVWLVLCAGLAPSVLVVQYMAPQLFPLWTHGKIAFDPWLFGMFSLSVLVLALAQPASGILQGNNILRTQLAVSVVAALIALGGMLLCVPIWGVRGAAMALLLAEVVSLSATVWGAWHSLKSIDLQWPWRSFRAVAASVVAAAVGLAALAYFPPTYALSSLMISIVFQALIAMMYWRQLPIQARIRGIQLVIRLVPSAFRRRADV